jgi:hypothetical protein
MNPEPFVSRILDDEGITAGLDDTTAQSLVAGLVKRVEKIVAAVPTEAAAWKKIETLCMRGRKARQFLIAFCQDHDQDAAATIAKSEGFPWPLISSEVSDPETILDHILGKN